MNRLDVKKLAAIGAGAALIGMALAPMATAALTKSEVLKGDNTPFDVVVGKNAATSDYLWAGNIAAKLAQLSTTDTVVSCNILGWKEGKTPSGTGGTAPCKGLSVDLTIGGTTTYSSESSKTYAEYTLDSRAGTTAELMAELTNSQLGTLYNQTKTWRYKGSTYSQTIREYMGIKADAQMDVTRPAVADLVLLLNSPGDFNYRVNYSKGLPVDNSATDYADFQAGDTDNVTAVLFGNEYKLYKVDTTRSGGTVSSVDRIKFVQATGEKTYDTGSEITNLKGDGDYANQTVSVKVKSVWSTTEAEFELLASDGTTVIDSVSTAAEGVYLNELFTDSTGNYALKTSLYLKSVQFNAATGAGNATIAKGDALIELKNGDQYPYSSTDTDTTDNYWIAEFTKSTSTSPDANVVTDIVIKNSVKLWKYGDGEPIYAGDDAISATGKAGSNEAVFLAREAETTEGYGYAKLIFNGWKNDQSTTKVKIGNGYVDYTDVGSFDHHVPFYKKLSNNTTQGTFTIDAGPGDGPQTFYYRTNTTDVNFLIDAPTDYINGILPMATDGNLRTDQGTWTPAATAETKVIDLNGMTFTCTTYGTTPFDFNCLADGNFQIATAQFSSAATSDYIGNANVDMTWYYDANNKSTAAGRATIPLTGSATNNKVFKYAFVNNETYGNLWLMLDSTTDFDVLYSKDIAFSGTDTDEDGAVNATYYISDDLELGGDSTDNTFYMATFRLDDNENGFWTNIYIQTSTDKIPVLPNNNLSGYTSNASYVGVPAFTLRADTPASYISKAYTDFGSLFDVSSGAYFEATMPQDRFKLNITVAGKGTATTVEGGTRFCAAKGCDYPALQAGVEQKIDSATYVVEKIACEDCTTAGCAGVLPTDVAVSPSQSTVKGFKKIGTQIVYTDDVAPSTGIVIVGGHLVNKLAAAAEFDDGLSLSDKLTVAGKTVVETTSDGDWVVAGFTANDTATAAKNFINQLDAAFG